MREINFFRKNEKKWAEIDDLLSTSGSISADRLSDLYIQLTDDLAYAQTNYPESKTVAYLNLLAGKVHGNIYKNKKKSRSFLINFFGKELPLIIYKHRKALLVSLIVFSLSCLIGAYSTHVDETFPRLIMGDQYVDMTIENIENGNPMGVYESMDPVPMFLFITFNNIRVSFIVFAAGIFFSVFTGFLLFRNGIMLGCFQYFFYTKKLLYISALTIWVHGTLEIASIVIAGGAGLALGNSFMFPGTYSRLHSFQMVAKDSVKIIAGLIPIFIVAGFLESFVTRYSTVSTIPAAVIILLSMLFLLFYFIYYPYKLHQHATN
ncbi:stage II sporulation protein M [Fulvivirga lutea]|uniref:Stage II sporulation protein M n=1 Tax=Fulvivirga lutea TaxID=2810512 RepID=A0A974WH79_9BACT|nr:stage II sporulation protein M [Fulvivirga lutea]QSE98311.1 stage II sporulation protein M [Fulvivirga lutea]